MLETIDELLVWLEKSSTQYGAGMDASARKSIRAILEQHRDRLLIHQSVRETNYRQIGLEAIRAFVERVEKRLPDYDTGRGADAMLKAYRQAVYDELAAMEKETE